MSTYLIPDSGGSADQEALKLPIGSVIQGGPGNDTIRIGFGTAIPMGGNNIVTAYNSSRQNMGENLPWNQIAYYYSPSGIKADLALGVIQNGFGGTDTVSGINWLSGSPFDDTVLTGNQQSMTYVATAGNDYYRGGTGYSRVVYWGQKSTEADISYDKASDTFKVVKNFSNGMRGTDTLVGISQIDFMFGDGDGKSFNASSFDSSLQKKIILDEFGEEYFNNNYYISNLFEAMGSEIKSTYKQSIAASSKGLNENVIFSWDYGSDNAPGGSFLWTSISYNPFGKLTPINKIHDLNVQYNISISGDVNKYNSSIHFNIWDKNKNWINEIAFNTHWPWERQIQGATKILDYSDGEFSGKIFVHMLPTNSGQSNITLLPSSDVLSGTFDVKKFLNFLVLNQLIDDNNNIISMDIGCEGQGVGTVVVNKYVVTQTENTFPIFGSEQADIFTPQGQAAPVKVTATDSNGDAISYTISAAPSHGTITGGSDGTFVYKPTANFVGMDRFVVIASDGKGGTASQTVNITVSEPSAASTHAFRLVSPDGWSGAVGGNGTIIGTSGYQDVRLVSGSITLDGSFNVGGDVVRLDGVGGGYSIVRSGSSAVFSKGSLLSVSLPIGTAGLPVVFDDGPRKLVYGNGNFNIGNQSFSTASSGVTGGSDGTPIPNAASASAIASVVLSGSSLAAGQAAHIALSGNASIVGTSAKDVVQVLALLKTNLIFDPSFNQGGDILIIGRDAASYTAQRSSSSMVLTSSNETLTIPIGTVGLTLRFNDGDRTLIYSNSEFKIGTQAIGSAPVQLASTATSTSIDVGTAANPITLNASTGAFNFTDNAAVETSVRITGFGSDDRILVTGATSQRYAFTTINTDGNSTADLVITFNNTIASVVNSITLVEAVSANAFVSDFATAQAAIGNASFMVFG